MAGDPDLSFGQVAIKAGLLQERQVRAVLAEQARLRGKGQAATIGELCQRMQLLTSRQVQRILLAQEFYRMRHADELLAAILERERLVGSDEIRMALDEQMEMYLSEDRIPQPLGQILVGMGILDEQKLAEIRERRLELRPAGSDKRTDVVPAVGAPAKPVHPQGWLVVELGLDEGKVYPIAGKALLGRQPTNDVAVDDPRASRQHAQIWHDPSDDRLYILDLNTPNGTFLNGMPIRGQAPLSPEDRVQIGDTVFRFTDAEPVKPQSGPSPFVRPGIPSSRKSPTLHEGLRAVTDAIPLGAVAPDTQGPEISREVKARLKQLVDLRLTGKIDQAEYDRRRGELLQQL